MPSAARVLVPTGCAMGAAAFLAVGVGRLDAVDVTTAHLVLVTARVTAALLFLAAGALRLTRWWITGEARSAYLGAALVLLGGVSLPLWLLSRSLEHTGPGALLEPLIRTLGTAVVVCLVARGLAHGDDDSLHIRPRELLTRAAALTAGGSAVLLVLWRIDPVVFAGQPGLHASLEVAMALAWFAIAAATLRRRGTEVWAGLLAPLLCAMGLVEVLRLLDLGHPNGGVLAAAVLRALVAVATFACALLDLGSATVAQQQHVRDLSEALAVANDSATRHDAWREELTHDLSNSVAGLRAALHTLATYGAELDVTTAAELRRAALDEVEHLEHLVRSGSDPEVDVEFEVSSVVRTVVRTRRATGQDVRLVGSAGLARGRPGDLATALQNLLVNAAVHAPRSPVTVTVASAGRRVEISVSDRGPGLTEAQAEQVFVRGARSPSSSGSGLGLYVARTVMQRAGGDVELRNRVGGATFVLSLASVERRARPAPGASRGAGSLGPR